MAETTAYPRCAVLVGGATRVVFEATAMSSLRSPFATLSARVHPGQAGFTETEDARASFGYASQSSMRPRFGGRVKGDSIRWSPRSVSFSATGPLAKTQKGTGDIDDSLSVSDPDLPPDYDTGTYTLGWADATDGTIITDILAAYGLTDVNIVDTGRHFATLAPSAASRFAVKLASDQPGYDLIKQIDELTGCVTFDGPDGRVTRIRAVGRPGGSAARTLTEGVDFKGNEAIREKGVDDLYNKVLVDGQTGQIDDEGVPIVIHAEVSGPSPYIEAPPDFIPYPLNSPLIDTQEFAEAVAALLYEAKNWRKETLTLPLSYGDSSVYNGMTIAVAAPTSLDLTAASRWRVIEVRDTFGAQGYQTTIVCEGAGDAAAQGTAPDQPPIPMLDYAIEFEGLANGHTIAVVSLDSSGSVAPSGTIASRDWDGDPTAPTPIGDGTRAVAVYDPLPISPPPTVTLTITDSNGKSAGATRTIVAQAGNAYTRELWVAEGDQLAHTEDQVAWHEYPVAAVVIPEEAGDAAILAAEADGTLHRVLLDGTTTAPGGPEDVTALSQSRDRNGAPTKAAWAAAADGRVWRSFTDGVDWDARAPLPNGGRCNAIAESPYAAGDVYAGGGNVLYHSYDNGGSWSPFYTHANAAYVLTRFASGITADGQSIMWLGFAGPDSGTEPRIVERGGTLHHAFPPGTTAPYDITGLTISLDAARLFVTDSAGRAWTATTDGSGDLVLAAYDADLDTPRHAIRDGRFPVVWGAADAATWKSTDEGQTFLAVRDHAAHMVAYGRLRPAIIALAFTLASAPGAERVYVVQQGATTHPVPNGWQTIGFLDGGWAASIDPAFDTTGFYQAVSGADWASAIAGATPGEERDILWRRAFTLPKGTVKAATLRINSDDNMTALYINGTDITDRYIRDTGHLPINAATITIEPALLVAGGPNLLAGRTESPGGSIQYIFKLEVS